MLKKTLALGLFATGAIGLAMPANAQNVIGGSQSIHSQTVGANGSHVVSNNNQDLTQVLVDSDYGNYGHYPQAHYPQPNIVTGGQAIEDTTVGVNHSNVFSHNGQEQTNVLIDSDSGNYNYQYPYYSVPVPGGTR